MSSTTESNQQPICFNHARSSIMEDFLGNVDEIYDIQDPLLQADYWYSGIPVRRSASTAAGVSPAMINGRRAWIRKLLRIEK